ncbi:aminopeptidase [Halorubrum coriense DSM 10284]|uniref:Aminopeptidase n=1 Tax=Halorubrum coriense DSM 10284 TaxID=1227466 RepID=M0E9T0_9EURY|nr:aminopeptidase [Halorubrum coriense]ELZ44495.1 aminopeptidase [Halorubrum coriense DSM 10284]
MDDRIRRHARVLVDHCTDVAPEDDVEIRAPTAAEDLVVALYEALGRRGARATTLWRNPRATRAYAREMDPDDYRPKEHRVAALAETDVVILIKGARNAAQTSDVDAAVGRAASRAKEPLLRERLDSRWVITQHPTPADAQRADLSTAAWRSLVYDAVDRDWAAMRERQAFVADRLADANEVRVVAGDDTGLRLDVAEMDAYNDAGRENMPGGEVATAPAVDGVEGEIRFDRPLRRGGREVEGIRLAFAEGRVVDSEAERGTDALDSLLETDEGARRVGELGIGTNEGVDRVTGNVLFDEKAAGTVHVALGDALSECVPEGRTGNESAVHADLIRDVSPDARIAFDGETVYRDGEFLIGDGGD